MLPRFFLFAIISLSLIGVATGEPDEREAGLPYLRAYGPKEYGAQAQNWAVTQDQRGIIYIGNNDGVVVYDGVQWRTVPVSNMTLVRSLDVDSKGKDQRAFGRVFYTEEKSLIFYAFDLGDRNTAKRDASFQVWGTRGAAQNPAKSLGIFYVDDQKQNRWLLKFEDPRILAQIDSVFVTVEPPGGSTRPTGRKFLYAYLNANPNHP